jgi:hypothetical protein
LRQLAVLRQVSGPDALARQVLQSWPVYVRALPQ